MLLPYPIPLWDYIGRPLLGGIFLALLWLQWRFPLRRQHFSMLHRLVRNFVLSIPGFAIVRLAMLPIPIAVAIWAQDRHIGLLNWLAFPAWVAAIATFLLMDYAYWWWHWANHMIPLFWRFHSVHHTDLDLDVTTAARFHFGEMDLFDRLSVARRRDLWHRSNNAGDLLHHIRSCDALSSFQLAAAD
jgi:sterol desaturase/sphingolipid hydroxylase (fatty acid hydroxylase superfamily)